MRGQWGGRLKAELLKTSEGAPTALRLTYTFHATATAVAGEKWRRGNDTAAAPTLGPGEAILEVRHVAVAIAGAGAVPAQPVVFPPPPRTPQALAQTANA